MDILVVMKQTFDTNERIVIENGQIVQDGVEFVINPYDEYALEEAIRLKEQFGGEVTVITAGPARAESSLRTALAMGADKAVLFDIDSSPGDEYTISMILARIIKNRPYDLILAGNMAVDDGAGQVGPRLAELLNIPHVAAVTKLTVDQQGSSAEAVRDVEGDTEVIELSLPALITAQQGLNEPRYPSLPGIMKAKRKPLERLSSADLQLDGEQISAKTEIVEQFLPPQKNGGRILAGDIEDQVKELVQLLRNEAKVI